MAKKGGTAKAPDYSAVLMDQNNLAREQMAMAREQMAWAKEQYARDREITDKLVNQFMETSTANNQAAAEDRARYKTVFQPVEDRFVQTALNYDTPERREADASRAIADVTQQFDASRKAALANLESYGIDPSTTRGQALDVGVRTAQGAAAAGAANMARRQTEDRGIELVGQAVNLGRGYPGQIAQQYQTALGTGQGAVQSTLGTTQSGVQSMGTGSQWAAGAGSTYGNIGSQVTSLNNTATNANTQRAGQTGSMIGSLLGTVGGFFLGGPVGAALGGAAGGMAGKALS